MNRIHRALEDTIPDAPPSTVDFDRLIANSRRTARFRLAAGTVTLSAMVTGLVFVSVAVGVERGGPPTGMPRHITTRSEHEMTQARLEETLRTELAHLSPGVIVLPAAEYPSGSPEPATSPSATASPLPECSGAPSAVFTHPPSGSPEPTPTCGYPDDPDRLNVYDIGLRIQVGTQVGYLWVEVSLGNGLNDCADVNFVHTSPGAHKVDPECTQTTENGVKILRLTTNASQDKQVDYVYQTFHRDGTVVNADLQGIFTDDSHQTYQMPPLSEPQVKELALTPALALSR